MHARSLCADVDPRMPRSERKQALWRGYGFVCGCERCAGPPGRDAPCGEAIHDAMLHVAGLLPQDGASS